MYLAHGQHSRQHKYQKQTRHQTHENEFNHADTSLLQNLWVGEHPGESDHPVFCNKVGIRVRYLTVLDLVEDKTSSRGCVDNQTSPTALHPAHPLHGIVGAHHHSHNVNVHALPPASVVVDPCIVAPDIHLVLEMLLCLVVEGDHVLHLGHVTPYKVNHLASKLFLKLSLGGQPHGLLDV